MKLVIDANILFSAFLKGGMTRKILLDRELELYSPEFLMEEFKKYFPELVKRSKMEKFQAVRLSEMLLKRITFIEFEELLPYKESAKYLTIDVKDEPYVACALAVGADLWSRDRHLKHSRIKCWSTEELVEFFGKK